jgi:putative addiction module component (TIGR02574 family)
MATLTKSDIALLSLDDRLRLIDDLWESIEEPLRAVAPPDWHREILDRRIDEADQFPEKSISWKVAKEELTKKWLG